MRAGTCRVDSESRRLRDTTTRLEHRNLAFDG